MFKKMIQCCFVNEFLGKNLIKITEFEIQRISSNLAKLTHIIFYPIKSCEGISVERFNFNI